MATEGQNGPYGSSRSSVSILLPDQISTNRPSQSFIPLPSNSVRPKISLDLFAALGESLNALPQLLTFSFERATSAMRELVNADFAAQVINPYHTTHKSVFPSDVEGVSTCLSLLHCKISHARRHTGMTPSVRRTVIHLQILLPGPEHERIPTIRSVLIGRPELQFLQKRYFEMGIRAHSQSPDMYAARPLDLRYVHAAFIGRIATDGWQLALDFIEEDIDQVCCTSLSQRRRWPRSLTFR